MLSNFKSLREGTYGFRFNGSHQERIAGIYAIGWERQIKKTYDWDGLNRNESDIIVFQYTLKGMGEIKINDRVHQLEAGSAFFIKVPSNHRYYLPKQSDSWEFFYLTLFGDEALRCYDSITKSVGHILQLDLSSKPITQIIEILSKVKNNKITDAYEASSLAFAFLMALQRFTLHKQENKTLPDSIATALLFINNHFDQPLTLDDIVDVSGLSKYHFTRIFHNKVHSTPIQYLTKRRINESIKLLKDRTLSIDDIALMVGFSNGNYFIKVFRSFIGVPPGEYRMSSSFIAVDHMIMD